jgi:hypothetical protein
MSPNDNPICSIRNQELYGSQLAWRVALNSASPGLAIADPQRGINPTLTIPGPTARYDWEKQPWPGRQSPQLIAVNCLISDL